MIMKKFLLLNTFVQLCLFSHAQDVNLLVQKVKEKINKVNDYTADAKMKTNVSFLKVPVASVKLYFKRPDQLKIVNEKGISFIPKGAVNMNMNNVFSSGKYTVLDAGSDKIGTTVVKIVKLLPEDDNADVVLSTLYIDAANEVILKTKTTTRDNGTYELEMQYGSNIGYGLPAKIIFTFNTKDYKMPKGVTFDFEDGSKKKTTAEKLKNKTGKIELTVSNYKINKGVSEDIFK
jgi:outer membrane lipoprotein-sorting protein